MKYLSDQMLIEVYQRAVHLQLEEAFIDLLYAEMQKRNIYISEATA